MVFPLRRDSPSFSLPMRDGNLAGINGARRAEIGFSLPMRDGNRGVQSREVFGAGFSLPMRDGNTDEAFSLLVVTRVLAYL